jgi:hypothetical protein
MGQSNLLDLVAGDGCVEDLIKLTGGTEPKKKQVSGFL